MSRDPKLKKRKRKKKDTRCQRIDAGLMFYTDPFSMSRNKKVKSKSFDENAIFRLFAADVKQRVDRGLISLCTAEPSTRADLKSPSLFVYACHI